MYYVGTAKGLDCGDAAGQWLSKFLGKEGLRLLHAEQVSDGLSLKDCRLTGPLATSENDGVSVPISKALEGWSAVSIFPKLPGSNVYPSAKQCRC